MNLSSLLLSLLLNFTCTYSLLVSYKSTSIMKNYEPIIGKWNLLYSNDENFRKYDCELSIYPSNDLLELCVNIKRLDSIGLITYTKIVNAMVKNINCEEYNTFKECPIIDNSDEYCSLVLLKSEKYIKSVWIVEFPYFPKEYNTQMKEEYILRWKSDVILNRLYIFIDKKIYVFEKKIYKNGNQGKDSVIFMNIFIISNFFSILFDKMFDILFHL